MRKFIFVLFLGILLILCDVHAKVITQDEFENELHIERAYVVGNYLFNISNGFNPSLKDLLVASSYNSKDDINVYEIKITENINGDIVREYRELLQDKTLNFFPNIDIKYICSGSVLGNAKEVVDSKVLIHNISRAGILIETNYNDLNIERAYILGEYIFNLDNGYNPSLKDLLIAATTVESDDIKVYEIKRSENINGDIVEEYNELLSFRSVNSYPIIKGHFVYNDNIEENNYDRLIKQNDIITLSKKETVYTGTPLIHNNAFNISGNSINYKYYDNTECSGNLLDNLPINAGNYSVKAETQEDEYYLSASKCVEFNIIPSSTTTSLSDQSIVYTGTHREASGATSHLANGVIINTGNYTYTYYESETSCINKTDVLDSAPVNIGTYYVRATLTATANYNSSISDCSTYLITSSDITEPVVSEITGGTEPMATSQEIVLKCNDNVGVIGYYFGPERPTSPDMINETDLLTAITSNDGYTKSNFTADSKYYFACKDAAGNFNYKTISIRKYRVYHLIQKENGTSGVYTLNDYDEIKLENSDYYYNDYYIKYNETLTSNQVCSSNEIMNNYSNVTLSSYSFEKPSYDESGVDHYNPNENITINGNKTIACWYNRDGIRHIDIRNSVTKKYYTDRIFDNLDYSAMYEGIQSLTREDSCWNEETGDSSCYMPADVNYTLYNLNNGTINVYEYDENGNETKILIINKNDTGKISLYKYNASDNTQLLLKNIDDESNLNSYLSLLLLPNKAYSFEQNGNVEFIHIDPTVRMMILPTKSDKYIRNMRDIGGLLTDSNHDGIKGIINYGKLYRGAEPYSKGNREAFELLEIDVVYDVRNNRDKDGNILYANVLKYGENNDGHTYYENGQVSAYNANDRAREVVKTIMMEVIDDRNVFFHCKAGKDRTGTVAYLLEGILGVSQADMLSDYALTYFRSPGSTNYFWEFQNLVQSINYYDGYNDEEKFINWFLSFSENNEEAEEDIQLINRFRAAMIYGENPTVYSVNEKKCYSASNQKIHFIKQGGDAILLESNGVYAMIDTAQPNKNDSTCNPVINYLKNNNIEHLQFLLISHTHDDHTGCAQSIFDNVTVDTVYYKEVVESSSSYAGVYNRFVTAVENAIQNNRVSQQVLVTSLPDDTRINLGSMDIKLYNTIQRMDKDPWNGSNSFYNNENNNSIMALVTVNNIKTFLTGDMEDVNIMSQYVPQFIGNVDVMKLPHHGSGAEEELNYGICGLNKTLVDSLNPTYLVATSSEKNSYTNIYSCFNTAGFNTSNYQIGSNFFAVQSYRRGVVFDYSNGVLSVTAN